MFVKAIIQIPQAMVNDMPGHIVVALTEVMKWFNTYYSKEPPCTDAEAQREVDKLIGGNYE